VSGRELTEADIAFIRARVIHEDEAVLAFDKPAGLSSQGGRIAAATLDDLLAAFAKSNGKRPRLVHRLDRDTSGVILAAKTKPAAAFLGRALMTRRVKKTYVALVAPGAPSPPNGRIEAPLRRVSQGREVHMEVCAADDPDAESADTGYRTLAASDEAAFVELRPHTGRMHQLRVHMASVGRPIAGDARYGGALVLAGAPAPRLLLHAWRLRVPTPGGGEAAFEAPIPVDLQALAARLDLDLPAGAALRPNPSHAAPAHA
jgi:tRNA pseudouridine32 synthase/23S rRNA pseudouridine746 synthase